eukprot:TRINITY_DN129_c0_g1_i9.p1 TRINITY_DN129_c0_g1~~TRINITY_DN129_c0_g1_i9.p1  ORF type:complete len:284 (-),score=62.90 TRINITY_DN129_c0_g1_i9:205-1032(-)
MAARTVSATRGAAAAKTTSQQNASSSRETEDQLALATAWATWIKADCGLIFTNVKSRIKKDFLEAFGANYECNTTPSKKKRAPTDPKVAEANAAKLLALGVDDFHKGKVGRHEIMFGHPYFVKSLAETWPDCDIVNPSLTIQQATITLYWGELAVTSKEAEKDASTNRSILLTKCTTIRDWIKSGKRFGINIQQTKPGVKVGLVARQRVEEEKLRGKSATYVDDNNFFDDSDLPPITVYIPENGYGATFNRGTPPSAHKNQSPEDTQEENLNNTD